MASGTASEVSFLHNPETNNVMDEAHEWGDGICLDGYKELSEREQRVIDALDGDLDEANNLDERLNKASRKSELLGLEDDEETASRISQDDKLNNQVPLSEKEKKRVANIKTKFTRQKMQIFTAVFKIESGRDEKFKKQSGKISKELYNSIIVEGKKGGVKEVKYFVGGNRAEAKNWKVIFRIDPDGKIRKDARSTKSYPAFLEQLKAIVNEQPTTFESAISDILFEKTGQMVSSTSTEVSNIKDVRRKINEKRDSLPTSGEEIEMTTYKM